MNELPNRKTMRLVRFDYDQTYMVFVTICTKDRACILSRIVSDEEGSSVQLTKIGTTVKETIERLKDKYPRVELLEYVLMPNHIHLLLNVTNESDNENRIQNSILSRYLSSLKRYTNKKSGSGLWQSRSYDHIIRNREDYSEHVKYIRQNPEHWKTDEWYAEE